jgi:hypothetical protein
MRNLEKYDLQRKTPQLSPILPFHCNLAEKNFPRRKAASGALSGPFSADFTRFPAKKSMFQVTISLSQYFMKAS